MCGRFTIDIPPELLVEIFGLAEPPALTPRYNIAPTQQVPVIRQHADWQNYLDHLRWGLSPSWSKDPLVGSKLINARSETLTESRRARRLGCCGTSAIKERGAALEVAEIEKRPDCDLNAEFGRAKPRNGKQGAGRRGGAGCSLEG